MFWKHSIRNYALIPFMIFVKAPIALLGLLLLKLGKIGQYILDNVITALPYFEEDQDKLKEFYKKDKERIMKSYMNQAQNIDK